MGLAVISETHGQHMGSEEEPFHTTLDSVADLGDANHYFFHFHAVFGKKLAK